MHYDVIQVKPLGHLRLAVWFQDGLSGEVEPRESHLYGVFEALRDPEMSKTKTHPARNMSPLLAACHRWSASGPEHFETGYLADLCGWAR